MFSAIGFIEKGYVPERNILPFNNWKGKRKSLSLKLSSLILYWPQCLVYFKEISDSKNIFKCVVPNISLVYLHWY